MFKVSLGVAECSRMARLTIREYVNSSLCGRSASAANIVAEIYSFSFRLLSGLEVLGTGSDGDGGTAIGPSSIICSAFLARLSVGFVALTTEGTAIGPSSIV